ncbi:hypothetical protein GCM10027614_80680 [Micromonospora vulcania]
MHEITAPLRPGDQGAEVANLQSGLVLLLVQQVVPADPELRAELIRDLMRESSERIYEGVTEKVVAMFQESQGLDVHGVVDERSAAALNETLRGLGLLGDTPAAAPVERTVAGQVLRFDQTPFAGRVILYARDGDGPVRLGEDDTDPEGRYAVTYPVPRADVRLPLRVAAFDPDGQHRAEASIDATRPIEVVDLVVRSDGTAYRVTGRVSTGGRAGVGGLPIQVVDRNVGGDSPVAETSTGADGGYRAAFTYTGGKDRPDLQVYVVSDGTRIGASEVRYDAGHDEVLDIAIPDGAQLSLATEHAALSGDLAAHFAGSLRDLREDDDRRDVSYLANKTGWDARAVAMASLADEFSACTSVADGTPAIPPALFYTLFRAGTPATDDAIYRIDAGRVATIWQQGIDQGIVPSSLAADVPAAIEEFRTLSARQTLSGPAVAGRSSLAALLAVSMPDATEEQPERFARLRIDHQGDPAGFWSAVTREFGRPKADRLRLDGQLAYLTLNNAPLIERLHTGEAAPLTDPADLVERGFHRAAQWMPLIDEVPPEIPGADDEARQANYADLLAAQLRLSYPTATVAAMVAGGETTVAPATASRVHDFLRAHHNEFDIGLQPVEQYLTRTQVPIDADVQSEIARIQRVRQITPGDDAMNALLTKGLDSAYAVARYDRAEFVAGFAAEVGGATEAALIHARAQQVHSAVLNITTSYVLASNAPGIGVHSPAQIVNPAPVVPDNVGDVIAYPTLEKLLGDMDYCDCEECRSILSPAAYLVDLLQFVDRDEIRWEQFRARWGIDHGGAPYPYPTMAAWNDAGQPGGTPPTPSRSCSPVGRTCSISRSPARTPIPPCPTSTWSTRRSNISWPTSSPWTAFRVRHRRPRHPGGAAGESAVRAGRRVRRPGRQGHAGAAAAARTGTAVPPAAGTVAPPVRRVRDLVAGGHGGVDRRRSQLRLGRRPDRTAGPLRAEYALLTDRTKTLQQLSGLPSTTSDADTVAALSGAKDFSRRLGLDYDDVVELLRTRFVNPDSTLLPGWSAWVFR